MNNFHLACLCALLLGLMPNWQTPARAMELSPERNAAVVQSHYLQNLRYLLHEPWRYQPLTNVSFGTVTDWTELITIESTEPAGPLTDPINGPVIRITAHPQP